MPQGSIFVNLKDLNPKEQAMANRCAKLIQIAAWVDAMPYSITSFPEGAKPEKVGGRCTNVLSARDLARLLISNDARNGQLSHMLAEGWE